MASEPTLPRQPAGLLAVLARGERPTLYLIDTGRDEDHRVIGRVYDEEAGVLHRTYPVEGRVGWRRFTGDAAAVLTGAAGAVDDGAVDDGLSHPGIVARSESGGAYLLHAGLDGTGTELGQVYDTAVGKVFPPFTLASLRALATWVDFNGASGPVVAAATRARHVVVPVAFHLPPSSSGRPAAPKPFARRSASDAAR